MRFARTLKVAACIAAGLIAAAGVEAQPRARGAPRAEAEGAPKACAPTVSLDKRLVMEQWARDEACAQPLRTRVTDRFLGIACLETSPDVSACRAFTPAPGSRAFNTSRVFRCVDIALADTEQGIVVSRMLEWAAPAPKVCDWTAARETLAMEVDFVRGDVCVGGLCMPVDRLSTIGKLRLRELIESALRELGLLASTSSVRAGSVARN